VVHGNEDSSLPSCGVDHGWQTVRWWCRWKPEVDAGRRVDAVWRDEAQQEGSRMFVGSNNL